MSLDTKLRKRLTERRAAVTGAGDSKKVKDRHAKGIMTARERLDALFQPDTFQPYGAHIKHTCTHFGMTGKDIPEDGVIVGNGFVAGRQVSAFSQDFLVVAGTLGKMHARKMVWAMDFCLKNGTPLVGFKDSGGAQIKKGSMPFLGTARSFIGMCSCRALFPRLPLFVGRVPEEPRTLLH